MRALAKSAALDLPLVDELAADIFMGTFSGKFLEAAKITARVLDGSLYARYYELPVETVLSFQDVTKQAKHAAASSSELARLCAERAAAVGQAGGSGVGHNGKIIEQEQILTTHNLAALASVLGLDPVLRPRAVELGQACFRFACKELQEGERASTKAKLTRVKNSAYAWRQMVFFLSFADEGAQESFLAWADGTPRGSARGFRTALPARRSTGSRSLPAAATSPRPRSWAAPGASWGWRPEGTGSWARPPLRADLDQPDSTSARKASGRSAARVVVRASAGALSIINRMGRSRANSASVCRQAPQGVPITGPGVTTTIATGSRSPAATIWRMAERSAQRESPYEAFSTLHPAKMTPFAVWSAAPTW